MNEPKREDWSEIITGLEARGWTIYAIRKYLAQNTGRAPDKKTVMAWREGRSEPHHFVGSWLVFLRSQVFHMELGEKNT